MSSALAGDPGIAQGEAWVDDGVANARLTPLPRDFVEVVPNLIDQVFGTVFLSGLAPGVHTLYLRVQSLDGTWSEPIAQSFYLAGGGDDDVTVGGSGYVIQQAEAFIDQDPGEGNGAGGLVAGDEDFDDLFELLGGSVSLDGLSPGVHTLFVRVKDSSGRWSVPVGQSFYLAGGGDDDVTVGGSGYVIQQAEAFIDQDPGEGNGAGGLVAGDGDFDDLFELLGGSVSLDGLSPGVHTLYIRVKDSSGRWSVPVGQSFYLAGGGDDDVTVGGSGYVIQQAEAFIDQDPGEGNGTGGLVAGDGDFDDLFELLGGSVSLDGLSPGVHTLYVRVKDSSGRWSVPVGQSFYLAGGGDDDVTVGGSGYVIQQAEAFIDQDPGEGNGTSGLVAGDGNFDDLFELLGGSVSLDGLSPGVHTLYVRVKDSSGRWSVPVGQSFYLAGGGDDDVTVGGSGYVIQQAEAFIDQDPGEGNGTGGLVAGDGDFDDLFELLGGSVSLDGLSPGVHTLYIRVKDSSGRWSVPVGQSFYIASDGADGGTSQYSGTILVAAELSFNGAPYQSLEAEDGAFDDVVETVSVTVEDSSPYPAWQIRFYDSRGRIGESGLGDSDGDGLPDAWELGRFGNLDQGAGDDPDGDGLNNLEEYRRGSDPGVADSGFSGLFISGVVRDAAGEGLAGVTICYVHLDETHCPVVTDALGYYRLGGEDSLEAGQYHLYARTATGSLFTPDGVDVDLDGQPATGVDFQRLAPDLLAGQLVAAPDHGLAFDGVDDRVWINDGDGLLMPEHWTLALTAVAYEEDPQGGLDQPLVWRTLTEGDARIAYGVIWKGDRYQVLMENDAGVHLVETPSLTVGEKHHLAATFDGEQLLLYLDGEQVDEAQVTGQPLPATGGVLWLGYFGEGGQIRAFQGELGELQLWDRPRARIEIQREMARTLAGTEIGLLGYWTFEDAQAPLADATAAALDGESGDVETSPLVVVLPFTGEAGAEAGDSLVVEWRLLNQGPGKVEKDVYEYWYLSSDDQLDGNDRYLTRFLVSAVAAPEPGQSVNRTGQVPLPDSLTAGDYYLLLHVDGNDAELEEDEENNLAALPLHLVVRPPVDLAPDTLVAPETVRPGESVHLSWTVSNLGDGTAEAPWRETLWLTDADGRELAVGERLIVQDLLPGASVQRELDLILPDDQGIHGQVTFSVELDRYRVLDDEDRTNNKLQAEGDTEVVTALRLAGPATVMENSAPVTFRLYRNGDPADELVVALTVSDMAALEAPEQVTIPAGDYSVTFEVQPIDDGRARGDRTLTLEVAADGYEGASIQLRLLDSGALFGNLPDLAVSDVDAPQSADTDVLVQIGFRMENRGDAEAVGSNADPEAGFAGSWQQRIYLSDDDQIGDDLLVATHEFTGVMAAGGYTELSYPVRMPGQAGDYWVVVRSDVGGRVLESDEVNNVVISAQPIQVRFAYAAQVEAGVEVATAGTPVSLHGTAWTNDNEPAVGVRVDIEIRTGEFRRRISALTDATGAFEARFTPLPGEAGNYVVGAGHPGQQQFEAQDSFVLLGFSMVPGVERLELVEQQSLTAEVTLTNLSNLSLNGLQAAVQSQPAGVTATLQLDGTTLAGEGQRTLTLQVEAAPGAQSGDLVIRFQTDEGVEQQLVLPLQVTPLAARLSVDPTRLVAGMPLGQVRTLSFRVENRGNDATGELYLQMTDYPWLDLATPNPMPSLAAGESAEVVLTLSPGADLPLGLYEGMFMLVGDESSVTVPFEFRAVSDGRGDLQVEVVDEYFYFDESHPRVEGAQVRVFDQFTGELVTEGVTDADGYVSFPGLANDYYRVVVRAEDHTSAEQQLLVEAGMTNSRRVFISREAVRYEWKVREIEIEDRYEITIETKFETRVPMPVVVFDPPRLDLSPLTDAGQTMQIDLKATNHGLIAAQHFRLQIEEIPGYRITPLVSQVGDIPAQSTITVPLLIERLAPAGSETVNQVALASAEPYREENPAVCFVAGILALYDYLCGPDLVTKMQRIEAGNYSSPVAPLAPYCGGGSGTSTTVRDTRRDTNTTSGGGLSCCGGGFTGGQISQISCDECLIPVIEAVWTCREVVRKPSWYSAIECGWELYWALEKCDEPSQDAGPGLETSSAIAAASPIVRSAAGYSPATDPMWNALVNLMESPTWLEALFGAEIWGSPEVVAKIRPLMMSMGEVVDEASENGEYITPDEAEQVLAPVLPSALDQQDLEAFRERWNRSLDYWAAGIESRADLPPGRNPDFIAVDELDAAMASSEEAYAAAEEAGFEDPLSWLWGEVIEFSEKDFGEEGVCAVVKLKLEQSLVLTRQGFEATLDLNNGTNQPLTQIQVRVNVYDDQGNLANERFGITEPLLMNLDAVDGTGSLLPQSTGTAQWVLAPGDEAAPDGPADYFIGGTLSYREGEYDVSIDLMPVRVTVRPNASLVVHYFHQRDVYGDDPFTDEVEPSLPYSLGVLVKNDGAGTAYNLHIDSGEPEIVDNEKGLLIDFDIIAAQVAGQNVQPSLSLELGDVGPGQVALGQWFFTSSLQGHFIDYKASFTHVDPLGILTSLVKEVQIHEMVRPVRALGEVDDGLMDFLVNDDRDDPGMPDSLYLSDGSVAPVALSEGGASWTGSLSAENLTIQLQVTMGEGYRYLRTADPAGGDYRLVSVRRSDGLELPVGVNVWQTDRTFPGVQQDPVREHLLHLFDADSTGLYTLTYEPIGSVGGGLMPIDDQHLVEGQQLNLQVRLAQSVTGSVQFELGPGAPAGMQLDSATGILDWLTSETDGPGQYEVTVRAVRSDGTAVGDVSFTVFVSESNQAPRIQPVEPVVQLAGSVIEFTVQARDDDVPANLLHYSLVAGAPADATLDEETGLFRWPTTAEDVGDYQITVRVSDDGTPTLTDSVTIDIRLVSSFSFHGGLFYGIHCEAGDCGLLAVDALGGTRVLWDLPDSWSCTLSSGEEATLNDLDPVALAFDPQGRLWALLDPGVSGEAGYLAQLSTSHVAVSNCRQLPVPVEEGLAALNSGLLLARARNGGLLRIDPDDFHLQVDTLPFDVEGEVTALAAGYSAEQFQVVLDGSRLARFQCDADCGSAQGVTLLDSDDLVVGGARLSTVDALASATDGGLFAIDTDSRVLLRIHGGNGLVTEEAALTELDAVRVTGLTELRSRITFEGAMAAGSTLHLRFSSLLMDAEDECLVLDVAVDQEISARDLAEAVAAAIGEAESLQAAGIHARTANGNLFVNAAVARVTTEAAGLAIAVTNAPLLPDAVYPSACVESQVAGDLDGDGEVNLLDLDLMREHLGAEPSGYDDPYDLNHDGVVDILDVRKLMLQCTRPRCAME